MHIYPYVILIYTNTENAYKCVNVIQIHRTDLRRNRSPTAAGIHCTFRLAAGRVLGNVCSLPWLLVDIRQEDRPCSWPDIRTLLIQRG